jgi:hypothetical protein
MFTIVVGTDEACEVPLLLHAEDALPGGAFRWRFIAQTDDESIAAGVMKLMYRRCFSEPPDVASRRTEGRLWASSQPRVGRRSPRHATGHRCRR